MRTHCEPTDSVAQAGDLPMNEVEFCIWVGEAGIGDRRVYYLGYLARDRSPTASRLGRSERAELSKVARRALALAEAGLAQLVQRRLGPDYYEYQIVICPRFPRIGDALSRVLAAELG